MVERSEPDIFVQILNKVDQIDGIAADVREIKFVVREHSAKLAEHDSRFDRIDQRLDRIDQTLAEHTVRLDQVESAVIETYQEVKQHSRDSAELKSR